MLCAMVCYAMLCVIRFMIKIGSTNLISTTYTGRIEAKGRFNRFSLHYSIVKQFLACKITKNCFGQFSVYMNLCVVWKLKQFYRFFPFIASPASPSNGTDPVQKNDSDFIRLLIYIYIRCFYGLCKQPR